MKTELNVHQGPCQDQIAAILWIRLTTVPNQKSWLVPHCPDSYGMGAANTGAMQAAMPMLVHFLWTRRFLVIKHVLLMIMWMFILEAPLSAMSNAMKRISGFPKMGVPVPQSHISHPF